MVEVVPEADLSEKNTAVVEENVLRQKLIETVQENDDLKNQISELKQELSSRDVKILELQNQSQTSQKREQIGLLFQSLEESQGVSQSDRTLIFQQTQEISKLKSKCEVLVAQLESNQGTISDLKIENTKAIDSKQKWIDKLDDEIEKNAKRVQELNQTIQILKDTNFKQEFQLKNDKGGQVDISHESDQMKEAVMEMQK